MENFDLVPLDQKYIGQFFAGDCYVILYTYQVNGRDNYIVYYWQVSFNNSFNYCNDPRCSDSQVWPNSVDLDQTAPGSILFAITYAS